MALTFAERGRLMTRLGWMYLAIIYVGSIVLLWHYALDGLVGSALALACWRLAGRLHTTGEVTPGR